jgi:hypothetical protein
LWVTKFREETCAFVSHIDLLPVLVQVLFLHRA